MNAVSVKLPLDTDSIADKDLSMPALMRELNLQKRPSWLLRKLMNILERKRQEKGLGWSREWNKKDLNIFRTHTHDMHQDQDYLKSFEDLIDVLLQEAPEQYRHFATELLSDPDLMAFTFYHNHDAETGQYEGLTVSLGRKVPADRSKRDRIDLILEDRREGGRVDGALDRIRLFVCPWADYKNDKKRYFKELDADEASGCKSAQSFFEESVRCYHKWKGDESRQWNHWSVNYIDYFGARSFIPLGTSFS